MLSELKHVCEWHKAILKTYHMSCKLSFFVLIIKFAGAEMITLDRAYHDDVATGFEKWILTTKQNLSPAIEQYKPSEFQRLYGKKANYLSLPITFKLLHSKGHK